MKSVIFFLLLVAFTALVAVAGLLKEANLLSDIQYKIAFVVIVIGGGTFLGLRLAKGDQHA